MHREVFLKGETDAKDTKVSEIFPQQLNYLIALENPRDRSMKTNALALHKLDFQISVSSLFSEY